MTSHELPVFRFYDRKSKRRRHELEKTVEHAVKKFKDEKLPQEFRSRITGPSTEWKTFFRQQDAFLYSRHKTEDSLHVFAYESGMLGEERGQRMYLVATYPVFWHYYSQLKEIDRHHYEVIPEGAVSKLYFDLEFAIPANTDRDGTKMVDVFIKYVCLWMKEWYHIDCSRSDVLDLDACTEKKFSRHLIFQLKDVAFKDNTHAGRFVCHIFNQLLEKVQMSRTQGGNNSDVSEPEAVEYEASSDKTLDENSLTSDKNDSGFESPLKDTKMDKLKKEKEKEIRIFSQFSIEDLKSLVVLSKDGKKVLFCDMGVYTKNRNFRLIKSTKLGKKNPFVVAPDNKYKPKPVANSQTGFDLFSDSLIANVRYSERLRVLTFGCDGDGSRPSLGTGGNHGDRRERDSSATIEGYTKSPYPEIDEYILRTVSVEGKGGYIRHWTYFTEGELLIYDIARYRWCANIQRQHRSNNIMLCVDMKKGVYYQKCHDPECKAVNFKSEDQPVPPALLPGHYFPECGLDSDFDDDDMMEAATAAERSLQEESDDDLLNATLELEKSLQ